MGLRQKEWATRARKAIIVALGGKCQQCGTKRKLELDVVYRTARDPHSKHHRQWSFDRRVSFWRAEMAENNLQLLCSPCNASKGRPEPKPELQEAA